MRLIDADALIDALCKACSNGIIDEDCDGGDCGFVHIIKNMPEAEIDVVKSAEWEAVKEMYYVEHYKCSNCGYPCSWVNRDYRMPFCGMCGAKMANPFDRGSKK